MIYTVTFNPAIDLVMSLTELNLGDLNRVNEAHYVVGGKGINMSVMLKRLGLDNMATGFLGGFTGDYITSWLEEQDIPTHFVEVDDITRINVKVHAQEETEINGAGAYVSAKRFKKLYTYFSDHLQDGDTVFLAGNAAPGMDTSAYQAIAKLCHEKQVYLVLDTNKDLLKACLEYRPFIIKPNHHELGQLFDLSIQSEEEIIYYAKLLQEQGARNVLVSRGGQGALLLTEDGDIYTSTVPKGQVINSVGAGDSMLAGFMAKYLTSGDYALSLQQGAATGSATAFSIGIAQAELVKELLPQVQVTATK